MATNIENGATTGAWATNSRESTSYGADYEKFGTEQYDQIPVQDRRGAIRVLVVSPGTTAPTEVQCTLVLSTILRKEDRLPNEPDDLPHVPYDALSWNWGIDPPTAQIEIIHNGHAFVKDVRPGLHLAICALRKRHRYAYLWIDAICINQDNKLERNAQVELMSEIYGRAKCARIWLGPSNHFSDRAIWFIKQKILRLHHFDDLAQEDNSDNWTALLNLMQRSWFSRRWVIQEVALARRAMLHCGTAKLSWTKFAIAVELFMEIESATHRLSEIMKTRARHNYVPPWFEYITKLGASQLVDATSRLFRDVDQREWRERKEQSPQMHVSSTRTGLGRSRRPPDVSLIYDSEDDKDEEIFQWSDSLHTQKEPDAMNKGQPLLSLEYLVSSMTVFGVTNPHDCIYALLSIAKDTTPTAVNHKLRLYDNTQKALEIFTARKQYTVDYEASYVDACHNFVHFCIQQNITNDPGGALDVICRPWAIVSTKGVASQPLPSWIVQLSRASHDLMLGPGDNVKRMDRKNADSLVGLPLPSVRNYNAAGSRKINRKTFKFRKRVFGANDPMGKELYPPPLASDPISGKSPGSHTPKDRQATFEGPASKAPMNSPANSDPLSRLNHFSMYVEGFVLDIVNDVQHASQDGLIPTSWAESVGWDMESPPPERFWRTLVADRNIDGKNPPVYFASACRESFRKGGHDKGTINTLGLIQFERNSVVAQFCRRVQAAIFNRALITTERTGEGQRLGLAARGVEKNDLVCILYGCSVPVILRRFGPKSAEVLDLEMEYELRYIRYRLIQSYKLLLERREVFRKKRKEGKEKYERWEKEQRRKWMADGQWAAHWELARSGIARVHEFRLWAQNKRYQTQRSNGDMLKMEKDHETMKAYVLHVLPHIHEIADWALGSGLSESNFMDQLHTRKDDAHFPKAARLSEEQAALWQEFQSDEIWRNNWEAEDEKFRAQEEFKASARAKAAVFDRQWKERHEGLAKTQAEDKQTTSAIAGRSSPVHAQKWQDEQLQSEGKIEDRKTGKMNETQKPKTKKEAQQPNKADDLQDSNKEQDHKQSSEWFKDNSWYLCLDSFRAWLREKGKLYGPAETMELKERWDRDEKWHARRDNQAKLQKTSFEHWIKENGYADPEVTLLRRNDRRAHFNNWNNSHPSMSPEEVVSSFQLEWSRMMRDSEAALAKEKTNAEEAEQVRFIERWRKGWNPQAINWREYELAVNYYKYWVQFVKKRKKQHVKSAEGAWSEMATVRERQARRAASLLDTYGFRENMHDDVMQMKSASSPRSQRSLGKRKMQSNLHSEFARADSAPVMPASINISLTEARSKLPLAYQPESSEAEPHLMSLQPSNTDGERNGPEGSESPDNITTSVQWKTAESSSQNQSESSSTRYTDSNGTGINEADHKDLHTKPGFNRATTLSKQEIEDAEVHEQKRSFRGDHEILKPFYDEQGQAYLPYDMLRARINLKHARYTTLWETTKKSIDAQHEAWKKRTPKRLRADGEYVYDISRSDSLPRPARLEKEEQKSVDYREKLGCKHFPGHYSWTKVKEVLSEEQKIQFMTDVRKSFRTKMASKEQHYYKLIGECYIDGMMDGEAMAFQNDQDISAEVFEIR